MDYEAFVRSKLTRAIPTGMSLVPPLGKGLKPHQCDLTGWSLRRGRSAIFASTGLGKSRCEVRFAREAAIHTGRPSLILAPCAVPPQTIEEGAALGVEVILARDGTEIDATSTNVYITNYEKLHRFDGSAFGAVISDESSVLKHSTSKTFRVMCEMFADTPFKLCATATPAPNDWTELGTHAEFLGICSKSEMLSEWFTHDGGETQKWRLKKHARADFWKWMATWAALVNLPSDLGHDDAGYILPPLTVHEHVMDADPASVKASGLLFALPATSLQERRNARKGSMGAKVDAIAELLAAEPDEQWVVWCELNVEQDALARELGDQCASIQGTTSDDDKVRLFAEWKRGEKRILLSKCSIFGWGLNLQQAARMAFIGVTDSYEAYFQAIRREYRFGQRRPVEVHIFTSALEGAVLANLRRKERDAMAMTEALARETGDAMRASVLGATQQTNDYAPALAMAIPPWLHTDTTDTGACQ